MWGLEIPPETRQFAPNLHDRREILRGLLKKQESFAPADQHWNEAIGGRHGQAIRDAL
jgi:hypothetical protein